MRHFKLVSILFLVIFINSCGEGDTADEWFLTEDIAPLSEIQFAKDSFREVDSAMYLHIKNNEGDSLKKFEFLQVQEEFDIVDTRMTTVADFSDLGFTDPRVLDIAVSICGKKPYAFVNEGSSETYFVDFSSNKRIDAGRSYNYASFYVNDCSGKTEMNAFLASGAVLTTTTGVKNLSSINNGDFFVYNESSGTIDPVDTAFDGIGNLIDIFENAKDIRVVRSAEIESDSIHTAIIYIGGDGKFRILQWRDNVDGFTDQTSYFAPAFNGLNVKTEAFDYKGNELSAATSHLCTVSESKDGGDYKVHMWVPKASYSDIPSVSTNYPGRCSVTNYTEATSLITIAYPWITYSSAKNELSLAWMPKGTNDIKTMLIDNASSSNWVFAARFNYISKSADSFNRIMIFYDDNEYLKLAVCRDHKKCSAN